MQIIDMFSAIAEPTRRNILEMLATRGQLSASDISDNFQSSAPAISQHLKVLREAKLVDMEKKAQKRLYQINPRGFLEMEEWMHGMTKVWNERFDRLGKVLEKEVKKHGRT